MHRSCAKASVREALLSWTSFAAPTPLFWLLAQHTLPHPSPPPGVLAEHTDGSARQQHLHLIQAAARRRVQVEHAAGAGIDHHAGLRGEGKHESVLKSAGCAAPAHCAALLVCEQAQGMLGRHSASLAKRSCRGRLLLGAEV